jgi:PAS domain S-box-containing protein
LKTSPPQNPARSGGLAGLPARLAAAEETLRAIRCGEVDSVMVAGKAGSQVFTLDGAEHAYRVLIESMNEGALMLTADQTILYANRCFARMVKCPLEQIIGSSFHRFLSTPDRATLQRILNRAAAAGAKMPMHLQAGDGSQMPGHLSIRPLARNGDKRATFGMVVTDMTEARRGEELLRTLTHRVVQAQEAERGRVALELHDTVTQMLCAVLVRSQTLADKLPARNRLAKGEAQKLHALIGATIEEVARISRDLRPSVLDHLGLIAGLHETSVDFANRTGVSVKLVCVKLATRLPADTELALYRILQETLKNVEKHARARHVTVHLTQFGDIVQLTIIDDGMGFDPEHPPVGRKGKGGFGLLGMRERAACVGGTLTVKSVRRAGTEIEIRIAVPSAVTAAPGGARKLRT